MDALTSMKTKLDSVGIYNITDSSNIAAELKAYALEIDRLYSELSIMLREYYIDTAQTYGITLREEFVGKPKTDYTLEKRREMLKLQQQMMGGECTPTSFDKFLRSCGISDFEVTETFSTQKMLVKINDTLTAAEKSEIEEKIAAETPAHITAVVKYSE